MCTAECRYEDCFNDAIYCYACCDACYCPMHVQECTKKICQLCNTAYTPQTKENKEDTIYCNTCRDLSTIKLQCAFRGCESVFAVTKAVCCDTYYCNEHMKYQDWKKCCPACTTTVRCIMCVKTKPCPCGYRRCRDCDRFFHETDLDNDNQCFMCFRQPYYHMNTDDQDLTT
jgi:hypothetical protein